MRSLAQAKVVDEIVGRVRTLRPDSRRRWGRMSAPGMVCHLNDAFRMATGAQAAAGAPRLRDRTLLKWTALYLPLSWPPGIRTVPEIDQEIGGTRPGDFAGELGELESWVRGFAARLPAAPPAHPIFGPLSRRQWLRWSYLHVDHHLRQFGA